MILTGFARLGKDAETRYTQSGDAVTNLALAFNYGPKDQEGKRATQWVDASMWGDRGVKLAEYLLKGQGVDVTLRDVHIETYQRNGGGEGSKLVGTIVLIDFAGSAPQGNQQGQQQGYQRQSQNAQHQHGNRNAQNQQTPGQRARTQQQGQQGGQQQRRQQPQSSGFEDMDDDIPF